MLTPEEEKRAATGYRWGIPKHDHFAGGRLQLVLHDTRGTQSSWSDTKTRTLERQLGSVLLAAEREAVRRRDQRLADERRRQEEEQRRAIEEQERKRQRLREARAKYQERLAADLRRMARAWSEAEELRQFINAVRDAMPNAAQTARTQAWLRWANAYADSMDPLVRAEEVPKETDPSDEELGTAT